MAMSCEPLSRHPLRQAEFQIGRGRRKTVVNVWRGYQRCSTCPLLKRDQHGDDLMNCADYFAFQVHGPCERYRVTLVPESESAQIL